MKPNINIFSLILYVLFSLGLLTLFSCKKIVTPEFESISDLSFKKQDDQSIIVRGNIILDNKDGIHFKLIDFNMAIIYEDKRIPVTYNHGKRLVFKKDFVKVPFKAKIPGDFIQNELLRFAMKAFSNKKTMITAKGSFKVEKLLMKYDLLFNEEISIDI